MKPSCSFPFLTLFVFRQATTLDVHSLVVITGFNNGGLIMACSGCEREIIGFIVPGERDSTGSDHEERGINRVS